MDKQAIQEELQSIFKLFKACIDEEYLYKLAAEKGITERHIDGYVEDQFLYREASEDEMNSFKEDVREILACDMSPQEHFKYMKACIDTHMHKLKTSAKKISPKRDQNPTRDEAFKNIEKEEKKKEEKGKTKNWTKYNYWHTGLIEWFQRIFAPGGRYNKKNNTFYSKEGKPILSIGDVNFAEQAWYKVKNWSSALGELDSRISDLLSYIFAGSGEKKQDELQLVRLIKKGIEEADDNKSLPFNAQKLIKTNFTSQAKNLYTKLTETGQSEMTEMKVENARDLVRGLQDQKEKKEKQIEELKSKDKMTNEDNDKLKKLEQDLQDLATSYNNAKKDWEKKKRHFEDQTTQKFDPSSLPTHDAPEVDEEFSGEYDPDEVTAFSDWIKNEVAFDRVKNEVLKYFKKHASSDVERVFNLLINQDLTKKIPEGLDEETKKKIQQERKEKKSITIWNRDLVEEALDKKFNSGKWKLIQQSMKKHLVEYSLENDDLALFSAMSKNKELLPKEYQISGKRTPDAFKELREKWEDDKKVKREENRDKKSYMEVKVAGIVDYLETLASRL